MVSLHLNDLRNPILNSFFLLCKIFQSFLVSGGISFDCPTVVGALQLLNFFSAPPLRVTSETWLFFPPRRCGCFSDPRCHFTPTVRGLVFSFRRCGWWTVPVCCGHCFHATSEGDEHYCRRRCGSVRIPKCSSSSDYVFRSPVDCLFLCFGQYLIPSLRRCGKGQTLGHPTNVSATARLRFSIA